MHLFFPPFQLSSLCKNKFLSLRNTEREIQKKYRNTEEIQKKYRRKKFSSYTVKNKTSQRNACVKKDGVNGQSSHSGIVV